MFLYLMRHGIAEANAENDFSRALTAEGRDRTHRAALGLARFHRGQLAIFSSPKTRARQTAQIVRDVCDGAPLKIWNELEGGPNWKALQNKLREIEGDAIFVGHEPHLSQLASEILTGDPNRAALDFKKAGVCVFEFDPQTGMATLQAFLSPKALRKMAPK